MKNLLINTNRSLKYALRQLNLSGEKCLIVIDDDEKYLGTLSDGDVRNAILNREGINQPIQPVYNDNSTFLLEGEYTKKEVKQVFLKNKYDLIPVIDKSNNVVDVLTWTKIFENGKNQVNKSLDVPVVIMAGGKGTRMEPFTKVLPKPLIPVGDKTIIEHIIERFTVIGCSEFYLTVNHKSKIMKAYFEELQPDYLVHFVDEENPLGTGGSLSLLKGQFDKPFFVSNCDIIVKADCSSLYEFHRKGEYDVTLVASAKDYIIPYGTCELNGNGHLSHINEKPKYDFLINTGLYVVNPKMIDIIPNNKFYHITHLIEDAIKQGYKVGVFPVDDDSWVDVGQWSEYKKAAERLKIF
jgi:dTDP-glucose pyrophosphorylase